MGFKHKQQMSVWHGKVGVDTRDVYSMAGDLSHHTVQGTCRGRSDVSGKERGQLKF